MFFFAFLARRLLWSVGMSLGMRFVSRYLTSPAGLVSLGGIAASLAGRDLWRRNTAMDMRGRVVVIAGALRGLGLAMAEEFATRGAKLVICARDEKELETARGRLANLGAEVLAVRCDVAIKAEVDNLVARAVERFGGVDVLVNNAGVIQVGPLESQTLEDFEQAMNVMYWGGVYATMAVLPHMRERRAGRIVNITSIGGKLSMPHLLPYCSAKFAFVGFSEGLRAELAPDGIKVVTVVPGFMRTGSYRNALFKGNHKAEYAWFSLGSNLPLASTSARKAAAQVIDATERGDAEIHITLQAAAASKLKDLMPGLTSDLLGLANRLLPKGDAKDLRPGFENETKVTSSFLTGLGQEAASEFNQEPAEPRPEKSKP